MEKTISSMYRNLRARRKLSLPAGSTPGAQALADRGGVQLGYYPAQTLSYTSSVIIQIKIKPISAGLRQGSGSEEELALWTGRIRSFCHHDLLSCHHVIILSSLLSPCHLMIFSLVTMSPYDLLSCRLEAFFLFM